MKPLVDQWLSKAQGDYRVMRRELRATEDPSYDAVCFHAQQCIEKLVKAFLQKNDIPFPKTHDLRELFMLATSLRPEWDQLAGRAALLTKFAIDFRYPGDDALMEDALRAVEICDGLRQVVLDAINSLDQLRLE